MSKSKQIQLKQSSILAVPLHLYEKDFSFIVNGEEFKTNRFVSDLLSPAICKAHSIDPTINTYVINTQHPGDFSHILQLANFEWTNLTDDEIPFLSEVIEILGDGSIEIDIDIDTSNLTIDNVLGYLLEHERYDKFYCNHISKEIEFISPHFFELCEKQKEKIGNLSLDTLMRIIQNDQLRLKNEDQLLKFINSLYSKNSDYSILYETVLFSNVTSDTMREFVSLFNVNDISYGTWKELSERLCCEIHKNDENKREKTRYTEEVKNDTGVIFEYTEDKLYKGIFNYIQTQTGGKIEDEVNFTCSSLSNSSYHPLYVAIFGNQYETFRAKDEQGGWICFDFKDHRVVPTHYTIRSRNWGKNINHPKSWVIEGSVDNEVWETVDEENNCSFLNGNSLVHTFAMNHPKTKKLKCIRMRSIGPDWAGQNELAIESFEIYGRFI